jgi:hypothetical protein
MTKKDGASGLRVLIAYGCGVQIWWLTYILMQVRAYVFVYVTSIAGINANLFDYYLEQL